jgi:lysophospholipase L1-like esterase
MMKKEYWFKISLIILPFLILFILEIFLRLFDFFVPEPLFIPIKKANTEFYQLNPDVAKRFFNVNQTMVPKLFPSTFARTKSKETIRIFCMGGSTTAGFPFSFQIPFPFQLQKILEARFPDRQFEVINMGISAINSYAVLDFLPEILSVEPDYIVIYMGHNEFYGAYGSASTISGGSNAGFIRFNLKMRKLHLVQMIERSIRSLAGDSGSKSSDQTLMEQVIHDKDITYGSEIYNQTILNFKENLEIISNLCFEKNVSVLIGNLVCNLRDQPPFLSTEADTQVDSVIFEIMMDTLASNRINLISENKIKKNLNALDYFKLAKKMLDSKNLVIASVCFSKARDLDMVRFRASSDFNGVINNVADKDIKIVKIDSVFRVNALFGIPGNELFTDHLHPTPRGYYMIAKAFAEAIDIAVFNDKNISYPEDVEHVTDLDMEMGLIKVYKLKHRWPFANKIFEFKNYKAFGEPEAALIAYDYIFNHHNWIKAHYQMADYFISQKNIQKAREEYESVNYYYSDLADPLFKIGETYALENNWKEAERYYSESLGKTSNKGFIYKALAMSQWKQRKMVEAVNSIQYAIQAFNMNLEQQTQSKFMLANMLIDMKRPKDSVMILKDLLNFYPNYKPAISLLEQLNSK